MASTEKFCLKWNDFESNVSGAFREIREERDFFDVTLACDDNQMEAHKVIISACSPMFRNILRRNPHQHPLLYLKGVKYKELENVLNFMYQGEVNVAQEDLNTFLSVAEELQVKGLTQGNNGSGQQSSKPTAPKSEPYKPSASRNDLPPVKKPRLSTPAAQPSYQAMDDDIQEVVPVKSEPGASGSAMVDNVQYQEHQAGAGTVALEDDYQEEGYGDYYDDGSGQIDPNTGMPYAGADGNKDPEVESKISPLGGGKWLCCECNYTSGRGNVLKHVESRHVPKREYLCPVCEKVLFGLNSYNNHLYHAHKNMKN